MPMISTAPAMSTITRRTVFGLRFMDDIRSAEWLQRPIDTSRAKLKESIGRPPRDASYPPRAATKTAAGRLPVLSVCKRGDARAAHDDFAACARPLGLLRQRPLGADRLRKRLLDR